MRRTILAAAIGALTLASASSASAAATQVFTVVNQAGVSQHALARVEHAVSEQSVELGRYWRTPTVVWGAGGWPVYLVVHTGAQVLVNNGATALPTDAYHWMSATGPQIFVPTDGNASINGLWSQYVSHEVMETLVDPSGLAFEVCDPVGTSEYKLDGVWVSDFVFPSYLQPRSAGPWDVLGALTSPSTASPT